MLLLINPLFLISFWQQKRVEWHAAPRTEDETYVNLLQ